MLEKLNLPCRYSVYTNLDENSYYFSTDTSAKYEILFSSCKELFVDTPLYNYDAYNVAINKIKEGTGIKDVEIFKTIEAVLFHFFRDKNRFLVYTCDSTDKKQNQRKRLFNIWYQNSYLKLQIKKIDGTVVDEDQLYFTSLLFHSNHQLDCQVIMANFNEIILILSK